MDNMIPNKSKICVRIPTELYDKIEKSGMGVTYAVIKGLEKLFDSEVFDYNGTIVIKCDEFSRIIIEKENNEK
jgi:hypothetical protein